MSDHQNTAATPTHTLTEAPMIDDTTAMDAALASTPEALAKPKRKRQPKAPVPVADLVPAPDQAPGAKPRAKTTKPKAAPRPRGLDLRRKAALAAGAVATAIMALSVTHLTESIALLTGSHWALAGLLALGIDAGMLCAEAALLLSADREARRWATGYVWVTAGASALLNAYAFALHAPAGMAWAAVTLGVLIPGLVLALGKVGGKLWLEGGK